MKPWKKAMRRLFLPLSFSSVFALAMFMVSLTAQAHRTDNHMSDLAEELTQSVVNISTSQATEDARIIPKPQMPDGDGQFDDFFNRFFDRKNGDGSPRKAQSLGTGFIIDKTGIIVTNHHVIEGADEIVIALSNGDEYDAELLGSDKQIDLAVLKILSDKIFKAASFGNSDTARLAETVIAIGNPFGLGSTVTVGVISAKNRHIDSTNPYDSFIQTDAAINRGNSGGPLFNLSGEVIGINTAIISPTGSSAGIAFSIPSNTALPIIKQLIDFGSTRRGWLGVFVQDLSDDLMKSKGLESKEGALVTGVEEGSPAAKVGITIGDVLISLDGEPIKDSSVLPALVADIGENVSVTIEIFRDGALLSQTVTLGLFQQPETDDGYPPHEFVDEEWVERALGLGIAELDQSARDQWGLSHDLNEGVIIHTVNPISMAYDKDIRAGNVLLEVAGVRVNNPDEALHEFDKLVAKDADDVLLLIETPDGEQSFITLFIAPTD